jgi:hypothetical protein
MPILCLAAKNRRKKTDFGKPKSQVFLLAVANKKTLRHQGARPLKPQVRAKTVDASRHQYYGEPMQIQILRWRFDCKTPTRK